MTAPAQPHCFTTRVYYEDTDFGGIVYYANYLRYIERARTEWVRELGVDQVRMKSETGCIFAVRRIEADYLGVARFDDVLDIETRLSALSPARMTVTQDVLRGGTLLFAARVIIVTIGPAGAPVRLPATLRQRLSGHAA